MYEDDLLADGKINSGYLFLLLSTPVPLRQSKLNSVLVVQTARRPASCAYFEKSAAVADSNVYSNFSRPKTTFVHNSSEEVL